MKHSASLGQRADLYHHLAVLLGAGVPWGSALDRLAEAPRNSTWRKKALAELRAVSAAGRPGDGTDGLCEGGVLPPWEKALVAAGQRTGQVVEALQRLASEAEARQEARTRLRRSCGYPLLVAHLAVILLTIPTAVISGGWGAYFLIVGGLLGLLWGVLGGSYAGFAWLVHQARQAEQSQQASWAENLLGWFPGFGAYWRAAAAVRWSRVLAWYFQAGGGILEGLPLAGEAAGSAGARRVSRRMAEHLRRGRSLAEAAADESWLPEEVRQGLWLGEESGHLVEEMGRACGQLQRRAETALATWVRWVPRVLYAIVVVFTVWRILDWATGYYRTVEGLLGW